MDIAQVAGADAVKLVRMIVQAAQTVRHNKKTCQHLVHHVQIIGDLLEKLQTAEMTQHPEVRNALEELEETLRAAYMLVTSCQNSNYLYHLVMGPKLAAQFRVLQNRIASCLQVFPLISHIYTADRLSEILEIIRPTSPQAVKEVPRLITGCSEPGAIICSRCDARTVSPPPPQFQPMPPARVLFPPRMTPQQPLSSTTGSFKLSLTQLIDATNNFSHENQIGQGSFGCVYKGQLRDGLEVAVKRCFELPSSSNDLDLRDLELQNETFFLTKLQHANIVKLLGSCIQGRERILIYEYMSNGSFDTFIFKEGGRSLDWPICSRIIKGIADGLLYLHKQCGLYIIHGDLKPSNILLDSNMNPKISDFGFARTCNPGVEEEFADRIVGSVGFIAPEYRGRCLFSIKSDVYGFGALLLEVISGKRCFSLASGESGDDYGFLNKRAWRLWGARRLIKFVNSPPVDESERMEILRWIQIALLCVEENPANRPTMQEVALMLSCPSVALPIPQCPAYLRAESGT